MTNSSFDNVNKPPDTESPAANPHGISTRTSSSGDKQSSSSPSMNSVPNLLLKLLEACAKHRRHHDEEKKNDKSSSNDDHWCHKELKSFARLFPRLEEQSELAVRNTSFDEYDNYFGNGSSNNSDTVGEGRRLTTLEEIDKEADTVGYICALYRAIARGFFCPQAYHYLFVSNAATEGDTCEGDLFATDADIARGIMPRIGKLLQYAALDPMRMALSPLPQSLNNGQYCTSEDAIKNYHKEEDIGATIAALLNMMEDGHLLLAAVNDLINLSDDLSTIEKSGTLFQPPISSPQSEGAEGEGMIGDKIQVHVFTEVGSLLRKRSNENTTANEYPPDICIQPPSRRSLLALQCVVWTALQCLVPVVMSKISRGKSFQSSTLNKFELINSLLSSSRSTTIFSNRHPPISRAPQFSDWRYSPIDATIHSLLILRTKMAIIGLFTDVISQEDDPLTSIPNIDLALMAVEVTKRQLVWDTNEETVKATNQLTGKLEHNLESLCSCAVSSFMALAILSPNKAKSDIWSHSFPYLMDCIPIMSESSNVSLRRVLMRVIHAILSSDYGSPSNSLRLSCSFNATSFIDLFSNRCLMRGYFSHLFELVKDSSVSVSGPAVSIVALLLTSLSESTSGDDLVETACLYAVGSLEDRDPTIDINNNNRDDSPLVRLGSKRRKIDSCKDDKKHISLNAPIQSAFSQEISDVLDDAQNMMLRLTNTGNEQSCGELELISLVSESEIETLRGVTGVLRVLLSLRSKICDNDIRLRYTTKVIASMFECTKTMSEILVQQKSDDQLVYAEPKLLHSALSSIVAVGLHTCRVSKGLTSKKLMAAREAISYCAISAISSIELYHVCQLDDSISSEMTVPSNTKRLCEGTCCRLISMIGATARPHLDICLCGLTNESDYVEEEFEAFTFDDIMPLQCRSIILATMCPVAVDSEQQYEPTLTSLRCILANSSHSQAPAIVKTALLGLPTLFLSLSLQKDGNEANSAKYLKTLMDSFNIEDIVIRYTKSDIEGVQSCAFLTLSRLIMIYTASSLVAEHGGSERGDRGDQLSSASSYLWKHQNNPTTNGIQSVLLGLMSSDEGPFSFTASTDAHFQPKLSLPVSDDSASFRLVQSDSARQWMTSLIYLRSVLTIAPESKLRSFNIHQFFSDIKHYDMIIDLVKTTDVNTEDNNETVVSNNQIPPPVWFFLMPFFARDTLTQTSAARTFGQILLCNDMKVFSAFFIPESEMVSDINQLSYETAAEAVNSLFSEINFILTLYGLDRDAVFSNEAEDLPDSKCRENAATSVNVGLAIEVFASLCQWAPLNAHVGNFIMERAILALIRLWIASSGGYALPEDPTCQFTLASYAFQALAEIFRRDDRVRTTLDTIMSKIFSEFFLPQHSIVASMRYRLLSVFIGSFLLTSTTKSLRAHNSFEVSDVIEIMEFIDSVYPSIIVSFVKAEDHEAIQMCTAFRMFLLSEAKRMNKEEKRVQKKDLVEFIIGTRQESKRSCQLARSLVPGVSISTTKLIENAKLLCIKTDVISHVLPQLLLHPSRAPLRFFTTKVCQSELNYPDILREIHLPVLKMLVWELGRDDPEEDEEEEMFSTSSSTVGNYLKRKDVRLALTKGYLLREGGEDSLKHLLMSPSQKGSAADEDGKLCSSAAGKWIAPNFMYLLVNVVNRQSKRSEKDRFITMKCLRAILQFLPPSDSPQYMSQIMTAINNAISCSTASSTCKENVRQISKLNFLAVATLFDYIRIVASNNSPQVAENLTTITVALFPLFDGPENTLARRRAVQMLEWLASGDADENLPLCFNEIPFLPFTQDLEKVRDLLVKQGVQLDDIRLMSQRSSAQEDTDDDDQLKSRFYNRMNILSQLVMSQENSNVRKVVITHMTDLMKANRDFFHELIVNEELSSMHFLTVAHDSSEVESSAGTLKDDDAVANGGFITKLMIRLLSRCVDESNSGIRDAIASCLGEIGAIDPNRLDGKAINSTQFVASSAGSDEWRLSNPPWQTQITEYQLRVVTRHLVSGLKLGAQIDQHKISFSIQELLKLLDLQLGGENQIEMTPLLKEKLQEADVINIVEPFWTTNYKQLDTVAAKSPPFFSKSKDYFSWLSSFCRFLVSRSYTNKKSAWNDFFHSCRSAIRSKPGVGVAEFLLPLFILDMMCFGNKSDEDVVVNEFLHVLTFNIDGVSPEGGDVASQMNLREREKAANAVFSVMDVLRHWMEKEMERRYELSGRGGKSKSRASDSNAMSNADSSWPASESIKKIERLLKRIPLSSCAIAASKVGMRARALQFIENEGRGKALEVNNDHTSKGDIKGKTKFLKSDLLQGVDSQITQVLLGQLNDFDTMVFVAQKKHETDLTKRLTEEAAEREMYEDWEGAFQAYEQLIDSRLNDDNQRQSTRSWAKKGLLRCLLKLGRLDSVLNQASGMATQNPTMLGDTTLDGSELLPSAVEAAWRLGSWSELDTLINNASDDSAFELDANARYQLSFGRTMHSLHSKSQENVLKCLKDTRESIMSTLSSAARDGYTRSYPYLLQLQALREVESISSMLFEDQSEFQQSFINVVSSNQWSDRLNLSSLDTTGSNAIMNTRLTLSRMANQPSVEGLIWLDIGKVARKGGLHRVAEQSLIQANASFCKSLNVNEQARESIGNVKLQVAKLKHAIGESTTALKLIEDDIPASIFQMDDLQLKSYVSSDATESIATARRILQATEWMAADGLKSSSEIKDRYMVVLKLAPDWERAHFNYAKFLDSLCETRASTGDRSEAMRTVEECQDYLLGAVQHYGMSLQLGQKHLYQALPRLLAMWLEFTSLEEEESDDTNSSSCESGRLILNQELMNNTIKSLASKIPQHLFYTALPQLISRVEHQNVETAKNVALILRTVLAKYPRQSMWSCGWLRFSKSDEKKKAGDEIFHGAQKMLRKMERGKKSTQNVLQASKQLFQFFIHLAQFTAKGNHSAVKMKVPPFETALTNFIPPIQAALSLSPGALERSATTDVFPSFVPRMRAFNPELKIMQSKAKPKKVSIFAVPSTVANREKVPTTGYAISQDVGEMHFLVKQEAKGDLRKDSRVQDLNNVINRLFAQRKGAPGPNSHRKRLRLQLRTFCVTILAEDCGILEWVPNTESLRSVVTETYNPLVAPNSIHRRGSRITNFADPELRDTFQKCQDVYFKKGDLDLATKKFDELILKQYRPVLYWWFAQNFASPHAWYEARTNFTLSTAVWSAVGHIIGLGDRHSENILIDKESGECVHVDFDCIFDKGLLLPRPEVIPFRLTPNMLDAFGPTGANGMYTGALTESVRTLRKNRDTLLSVLEPFLNDPVINFKSKNQQKSKEDKDAKDARTARISMIKIEGRLNGEYNIINPNKNKKAGKKKDRLVVDTTHFTKLSVEGQVQKMIMEATDKENLVQVYVGWMPWI